MHKIISLFQRNYGGNRLVCNEVVPGAEWVLAGEGIPTRKWDGACCKIEIGGFYKRYELKKGKKPPPDFLAAQDPDPITGDCPGWVLCALGDPADKWFWDGYANYQKACFPNQSLPDGTYELVGPRINGNPENFSHHTLFRHGEEVIRNASLSTFDEIRNYLSSNDIEGIVWHHEDGRMVKIKAKDFGIRRPQHKEGFQKG